MSQWLVGIDYWVSFWPEFWEIIGKQVRPSEMTEICNQVNNLTSGQSRQFRCKASQKLRIALPPRFETIYPGIVQYKQTQDMMYNLITSGQAYMMKFHFTQQGQFIVKVQRLHRTQCYTLCRQKNTKLATLHPIDKVAEILQPHFGKGKQIIFKVDKVAEILQPHYGKGKQMQWQVTNSPQPLYRIIIPNNQQFLSMTKTQRAQSNYNRMMVTNAGSQKQRSASEDGVSQSSRSRSRDRDEEQDVESEREYSPNKIVQIARRWK